MAITITISTNRQIKTTDGGSIGATAGMTVELVTPASATDAEIQREIRHHYETITGAMTDQLRHLAAQRTTPTPAPTPPVAQGNGSANGTSNGTPKTPAAPVAANGNGKATPAGNSAPAPAKAPAATSAKPNGPAKATAAPQRPIPPQPAAQRNAMLAELDRQFAPRAPEPDDDLADDEEPLPGEIVNDEDDYDDDPNTGIQLLGWARNQPGDAKQELALIGRHRGFPPLIKDWSPGMVGIALKIYRHTAKD